MVPNNPFDKPSKLSVITAVNQALQVTHFLMVPLLANCYVPGTVLTALPTFNPSKNPLE